MDHFLAQYPYFPFRRDWGTQPGSMILDHKIALDALTPSVDDHTMRIVRKDADAYCLTITRYADINFHQTIGSPLSFQLSQELVDHLLHIKYLMLIRVGIRTENSIEDCELLVISDEGEKAWREMILD